MRVLVVEDERALADAIARGLRAEGMAVDVAYDGDAATLTVHRDPLPSPPTPTPTPTPNAQSARP